MITTTTTGNLFSKRVAVRFLTCLLMAISVQAMAQQPTENDTPKPEPTKKWYDSFGIRGYAQVRYNRLLETNPDLKCDQCDKSWGDKNGFFVRRMRLVFSGQISKRVYIYFQPDFASSSSSTVLHFGQLRDAYFDLGLDDKNEFRFRIGQSKVPFGFENLQSSQNRLPLDRHDALNSAVANERDLGIFFYWAPESKRKLLSSLVKEGLKGSGDYGVFALGAYNGQTANKPELNNQPHIVSRLSYPLELSNGQIIEPGIQGYTGKWVMANDQISKDAGVVADRNYLDQRAALSFVLYPKPFGIQAEYNIGKGPQFNTTTDSIESKNLSGGYVTLSYLIQKGNHTIIPFTRFQHYKGGKKHELDARSYEVDELEIGVEWQPFRQFELVAMYTISSRRFEDYAKQNNLQEGRLLRLQAQVNF
ncbi:MAG: OprO/OprP family phosphate-selective porin [Saprospiraceae bacterium]|nr:OprO/OprP family phosphate-selective porin [Saprospiraceae bacterium]MCF8251782.1 OprO/OprP family phosphate-selective porin [Saprospiraceae bacterium]MCF8281268.1 OprO/OprP family phosphate-selective porin [Bacteroidales bacterium]MCF8313424.1 OprO/OprP family phosphate-selective porin [Saprospiraceae bacterium]MCF8442137.1 OprO/OprP family phosphate-selective porin [Saprospiraceae bacterium]